MYKRNTLVLDYEQYERNNTYKEQYLIKKRNNFFLWIKKGEQLHFEERLIWFIYHNISVVYATKCIGITICDNIDIQSSTIETLKKIKRNRKADIWSCILSLQPKEK